MRREEQIKKWNEEYSKNDPWYMNVCPVSGHTFFNTWGGMVEIAGIKYCSKMCADDPGFILKLRRWLSQGRKIK